MGTGDDSASAKTSTKPASSMPEVQPTPPYPDWSSMQAYYGGGAPPPFFGSTVASPTPHPYMWGTQHPMMSPYGTPVPYPALYPPGAVYPHPNMAVPPNAATPNNEEGKGTNGKDRSSAKKLKGTSTAKAGETGKTLSGSGNDGAASQSAGGSDGSSDGSDENANQQEYGANKKGSFEQMLADASGKGMHMPPANVNMGMDLWNQSAGAAKVRPNPGMVPPNDQWIQDERELKRQKRKQSNRESARRSRLRKQAECEELQARVEILSNDNQSLKDELKKLSEECEKLTSENNSIKEELTRLCGPEAVANLEKANTSNVTKA